MQSLAFLWFDRQMTQRYLREKTFGPAPSPANSANLNRPTGDQNTKVILLAPIRKSRTARRQGRFLFFESNNYPQSPEENR
jgi:hypothetical protein